MGFEAVFGRRSASVVLAALVLILLSESVSGQQGAGGQTSPGITTEVASNTGGFNLPIPIPSSQRFYEGSDVAIDSCPRDEVDINGTCHQLLSQGPCQASDFVLLDPNTYEGYCAARLCAPDRVFVFSDQLCHDPFSSQHCPGSQELFQTAFGTPICQCPEGFLEMGIGQCVSPLTPSSSCPPGQVLWSDTSRSMQVCGPDPCGRLNLDRPLPSAPFVPSLADGTCHQLGQAGGVCSRGTFYSLDLEARRGVCAGLQDAGFTLLDATTQRLFQDLYGPFTLLGHTALAMPAPTPGIADPSLRDSAPFTASQVGQSGGVPGLGQGIGQQVGLGGSGQGAAHTGGGVMDSAHGSLGLIGTQGGQNTVLGSHPSSGQQQAIGSGLHPAAGHPGKKAHHRNHFIRGHNLGPVRRYKFDSLSKHFTPSRLDLSRLHATRGQNHLVRPFPGKTHSGATPPVKTDEIPARLLAQAVLARDNTHLRGDALRRIIAEKRDSDDDHESLEHQDSVADSRQREERDVSPSRRRRQAQEGGVVETRLVTCRAGARRHVNAKCRHTLLPFFSLPPSTIQPSTGDVTTGVRRRSVRSVTPQSPTMLCPQGTSINQFRQCSAAVPPFIAA